MKYVTTYTNPDADGVCSSLAYAFYKNNVEDYKPVYFGKLDNETKFILSVFNIQKPQKATTLNPYKKVVLLDTHNVEELSTEIKAENVIEIIDHHIAGGTPEKFVNIAQFQNEAVGAVATLIAEKMQSQNIEPDIKIAGIMALAIVSNTLNFNALSTSQRDIDAFSWLNNCVKITDDLIYRMFEARSIIENKTTFNILDNNLKIFRFGDTKIGIVQVEMICPQRIINRHNFKSVIKKIECERQLNYLYFTGIDLDINKPFSTLVYCNNQESLDVINKVMGYNYLEKLFTINSILLRKTHFVPKFKAFFQ